jgi:hypothetical protein
LIHEIVHAFDKPQNPVIGKPTPKKSQNAAMIHGLWRGAQTTGAKNSSAERNARDNHKSAICFTTQPAGF